MTNCKTLDRVDIHNHDKHVIFRIHPLSDLEGAIMITNLFPGHESAKQIVGAGIKCVWHQYNKYLGKYLIFAGERLLRANGVEFKEVTDT